MRTVKSRVRTLARRILDDEQRLRVVLRWRELQRPALRLRAIQTGNLDILARAYGTDKSSWGHDYARLYQRHIGSHRRKVKTVLEIGVGGTTSGSGYETLAGGHSLRMWSKFFPMAEIVGIDIHPKDVAAPRIHFERGDQ